MSTLIPALVQCCARMTPGERKVARRLIDALGDQTIVWHHVAIGATTAEPDFLVLDPERGLVVLEVKDWTEDSVTGLSKATVTLRTDTGDVSTMNPLVQVRRYAEQIASLLDHDPGLTNPEAPHLGRLVLPWGYAVIFPNLTRRQFEGVPNIQSLLPPAHVICKDDLYDSLDAGAVTERIFSVLAWTQSRTLTDREVDAVRWHIFPELRVSGPQMNLFAADKPATADAAEQLRVTDLKQEQLARGLGAGHRVIHGVAGSGKTMVLRYRAVWLARAMRRNILVLCFNRTLATWLDHLISSQVDHAGRVTVKTFHGWCRELLQKSASPLPREHLESDEYVSEFVQLVSAALADGRIPRGQYDAVLVDEGHGMEPEWLSIIASAVSPATNALLLLYDSAQSIYKRRKFSLKSIGIHAQGRTTILRVNYRCTQEILKFAYDYASTVLSPHEADEDGIPLIAPESAGRRGPIPLVQVIEDRRREAQYIIDRLHATHSEGHPWSDIAVLHRPSQACATFADLLAKCGVPAATKGNYRAASDAVAVLTYHSSKGLEFPVVALPGIPRLERATESEPAEVRLLYVAMTRATHQLIVTARA